MWIMKMILLLGFLLVPDLYAQESGTGIPEEEEESEEMAA